MDITHTTQAGECSKCNRIIIFSLMCCILLVSSAEAAESVKIGAVASTAIGSKRAAQQAVEEQVVAVIGASWSSHSLAMAPVLQEAKIPMISPVSTNPRLTHIDDYIFRVCFTDAFQGKVMAQFAIDDLQAERAAVLTNGGNQDSIQLSEVFIKEFETQGGEIALEADYLQEATDSRSQLENIVSLKLSAMKYVLH